MSHIPTSTFPALKSGVQIHSITPELIALRPPAGDPEDSLGLPATYFEIDLAALLKLFDGRRNLKALAEIVGLGFSEIEEIVMKLKRKNLVNLYRTPIPYQSRYNSVSQKIESVADVESIASDPAIATYLERCEIEARFMEFHPNVVDYGRRAVLARREFSILIFGSNRLATQIGTLLIASGFSDLRFINRKPMKDPSLRISPRELTGNIFRSSDVGLNRINRFVELSEEFALFSRDTNIARESEKKIDLIISTEDPSADQIQRWMNEETRHLVIRHEIGGIVRIGPLVEPGKSPCLRCIELTTAQETESQSCASREIPSSLSALITGLVVADIANLSHSGESVFRATTWRYSLRRFINPLIEKWQSHPACGCYWR